MTNSFERLRRIEESMQFLRFSDDKILIKLMGKWGISRRVAKEYLDVMKDKEE